MSKQQESNLLSTHFHNQWSHKPNIESLVRPCLFSLPSEYMPVFACPMYYVLLDIICNFEYLTLCQHFVCFSLLISHSSLLQTLFRLGDKSVNLAQVILSHFLIYMQADTRTFTHTHTLIYLLWNWRASCHAKSVCVS